MNGRIISSSVRVAPAAADRGARGRVAACRGALP